MDSLFHALADATRRDILHRCVRGEPSVSRLADAYPIRFAAVQKHVAVLERGGLVTKERRGREHLVRTNVEMVLRGRDILDELELAWRGRVDRMAELLTQAPEPQGERTSGGPRGMTVICVERDYDSLSLLLIAEFDISIDRVWQLWADPRQLEQWWGPPSHPATVERHNLTVGGDVIYFMTGPDGDKSLGWWRVTSVEPPLSLDFTDGYATEDGTPNAGTPTTAVQVRLREQGGGTRMELRFIFESPEHMKQLERWGAFDVFPQSVGQIDALLATESEGSEDPRARTAQ